MKDLDELCKSECDPLRITQVSKCVALSVHDCMCMQSKIGAQRMKFQNKAQPHSHSQTEAQISEPIIKMYYSSFKFVHYFLDMHINWPCLRCK